MIEKSNGVVKEEVREGAEDTEKEDHRDTEDTEGHRGKQKY